MGGRVGGLRVRAVARAGQRAGGQRARVGCDDPRPRRNFYFFLILSIFEILHKDIQGIVGRRTTGAKQGAWWARVRHTGGTPIWVQHVDMRVRRACETRGWFI